MKIVCLDLEGVLVPEIWIEFSKRTGIPELMRTTRDEPDYDKLMTYRLMAEWATDALCRKLGNTHPCTTADRPLPGSQEPAEATLHKIISLPASLRGSAI